MHHVSQVHVLRNVARKNHVVQGRPHTTHVCIRVLNRGERFLNRCQTALNLAPQPHFTHNLVLELEHVHHFIVVEGVRDQRERCIDYTRQCGKHTDAELVVLAVRRQVVPLFFGAQILRHDLCSYVELQDGPLRPLSNHAFRRFPVVG